MMLRYFLLLLLLFSGGLRADALDAIRERGAVRVGVALFVPWTMKAESGELYGFEVDVARKIAEDIGVKPELKLYEWEQIIPALEKGEIDMIAAGMAITPARALKVNFSQPYSESGVSLATNTAKTRNFKKLEELNAPGIVISTVEETISADVARQLFSKAKVVAFKTSEQAEQAVLSGEAHAYIASIVETRFLALQHPDKIDQPMKKPLLGSVSGFGVRRGEQQWLNFLNAWIAAREADKWLPTRHKYWFDSLDWSKATPR